jgi:hypothetical protein
MSEATKTLPRHRRRDHRLLKATKTLVFEIALAITLCVWIVTLIAWALG